MNFIIETVTDCQFSRADKSQITCMVKFAHLAEPVPFTADPNDCESHGREIFARANARQYGTVAAFVARTPIERPKSAMELRIEKLEAELATVKIAVS